MTSQETNGHAPMRIGIDVGGTNTDAALLAGTAVLATAKVPTSADVIGGIAAAVRGLGRTQDLTGVDRRAQAGLDQARAEWEEAGKTLQAGKAEQAADHLARAREHLSAAEADASALTERLRLLRETKADPQQAAKQARFKVRDAQLLVVGKGLVPQWGSVLDAQVERIDRAVADLVGPHPNYWAYLQTLDAVESFVRDVVDRIRGELR